MEANQNTPRDLREFIGRLEAAGELERRSEPISFRDIARVIEDCDKAIMIEHPVGHSMPILAKSLRGASGRSRSGWTRPACWPRSNAA